jgi:tetratricopeptide (TPR) repeat protein
MLQVLDKIGDLCIAKGDFSDVIKACETAMEEDPMPDWQRYRVCDRLGRVYEAMGDTDQMIKVFRKAVDIFQSTKLHVSTPSLGWPWERLAMAYKAKGEYELAIQTYEDSVRHGGRCWNDLWECYEAKGDNPGAIKSIERLTKNRLPLGFLWRDILQSYTTKGRWDRAVKLAEFAIEQYPTESWPWICLGDWLYDAKDLTGAITAYETAIKYEGYDYFNFFDPSIRTQVLPSSPAPPAPPAPPPSLVVPFDSPDNFLSPFPPPLFPEDGDELFGGFPTLETEDMLKKILRRLGDCYESNQDHDDAIRVYERVLNLAVGDSLAWTDLSRACCAKGDHDKLIRTLTNVVVNRPMPSWASILLSKAYSAKNDFDNAIKTLQDAVENDMTFLWEYNVVQVPTTGIMQLFYTEHGRVVRCQLVTSNFIFHIGVGDYHKARGDNYSAIRAYKSAIQAAPNDTILFSRVTRTQPNLYGVPSPDTINALLSNEFLWKRLGESYKAIGEHKNATSLYKRAITTYRAGLMPAMRAGNNLVWHLQTLDFREKLSMGPLSEIELWSIVGEAYREIPDIPKAFDAFRNAWKREPNNPWLRNIVGDLGGHQGAPPARLPLPNISLERPPELWGPGGK